MPDSKKTLPLKLAGTLLLAATCFFVGRYSVGETNSQRGPAQNTNEPTVRTLTALEKPTLEGQAPVEVVSPEAGHAAASERINLSEREEQALKTASDFIAEAAEQMDDLEELQSVVGNWFVSDPESAIEWLAQGERRDAILRVLFTIWATESPGDSLTWLESHKGTEGYSSAVLGHALGIARDGGFEEALEWTDSIDDPLARTQIWNAAGEDAYGEDPDSTLLKLADSGLPDDLQLSMVEDWNQRIRNRGKRNAQNLASVYSSAVAAGANFQGRSSEEVVRELVVGVNGSDSFATTRFQVPNMNDSEIEKALSNLAFREGQLNYNPGE